MSKKFIFIVFSVLFFIITNLPAQNIKITEIMFNPAGNERYNEFVEIYNTSESDTIDLAGWMVSDGTKMNEIIAHEQSTRLAPNQFALIFVPKYFTMSKQYEQTV